MHRSITSEFIPVKYYSTPHPVVSVLSYFICVYSKYDITLAFTKCNTKVMPIKNNMHTGPKSF